jgi:hypothetical protein
VTQLTIGSPDSPPRLKLPVGEVPDAQLPAILRQAATNLASCPAWQAGFRGGVSLQGEPGSARRPRLTFDGQQRVQLVAALAPLGGPAVKQVEVSINGATLCWGRAEVQALARSLGGQVSRLQLGHCTLISDFWVALDECFAALTSLRLQQNVTCPAPDVAFFCSTRAADRPLALEFGGGVYNAVHGQQVQDSLAARGMAHVSLVRVPYL